MEMSFKRGQTCYDRENREIAQERYLAYSFQRIGGRTTMAISVSMLEFFRTGAFGPLHLGMARVQIEAILGPPDDYAVLSRRERRQCKGDTPWKYSRIWLY